MTKLLNLDELTAPTRVVRFRGVEHEIKELTFSAYVAMQKDLIAVQSAMSKDSAEELLAHSIKIIGRSVPSMESLVCELNDRQLIALVQMISDVYPDQEGNTGPKAEAETETAAT